MNRLKTRNILDSIRHRQPQIDWHYTVWHRLNINRYAHLQWLSCLGRLNTLQRLASFGMDVIDHCYLCVGGREDTNHLFLHCPYSNFILRKISKKLGLILNNQTWLHLLQNWLLTPELTLRLLALLVAQIFSYHIWRERNGRAHNRAVTTPMRLLQGIWRDFKAKLSSSSWFAKRTDKCTSSFNAWLNS